MTDTDTAVEKLTTLNERIASASDHPLSVEEKIKACYMFGGALDAVHVKLDAIREGDDRHHPLDHNVEQAQIALETAVMRLGQLLNHLQAELPNPIPEPVGDPMDYWTVREIADKLNVSHMTVYRMTEDGTLPSFKVGRHIRITKAAFANYMEGLL